MKKRLKALLAMTMIVCFVAICVNVMEKSAENIDQEESTSASQSH